jgi:UDP-N-acetylglucosamine--N-acetylmuramyl-(pentapeptide) pyrophosphoryl-undecaprenol N-acetylglucosamine transferase
MRIALTGGGTGGHIFPIVAVVEKIKDLRKESGELEFLFLGPNGELEKKAMEREFIPAKRIQCGKLRRYFSFLTLSDFAIKIPVGIVQSLWHLLVFMPEVVFAKGGYVSFPVVVAAWIYRIPVILHESDATPGLANQILSRFAKRIAVSFSGSEAFFPERKVFLSGNPIRDELAKGSKEEAMKKFALNPERKTILAMGGSQGARTINHVVLAALPKLLKKWQVIHITGEKEYESVVQEAGKIGIKAGHGGYLPFPFLWEDMPLAFSVADLVISRAGANALAEIAANAKPSIIIPIEGSANKHQEQNAFVFSQAGAAIVLEQGNLGENLFLEKIESILEDNELSFELKERVKKFYNPKAAEIIAGEIIKMAE